MGSPRWFTTADRYLFGQLLWVTLFGLVLFSIIWLAPETLFKLIQAVVNGKLTPTEAIRLFFWHIPAVLLQAIPMTALMAPLFLFQRLSHSLEWTALITSGVRPARALLPIFTMGLLLVGVFVGIQEAWLPVSQKRLQQGYVAARLRKPKEASVLFLEHDRGAGPTTDDTRLNSLTLVGSVQQPLPNGAYRRLIQLNYAPQPKATQGVYLSELIRAEEAKWDVRRQAWHLRQGTSYMLDAQGVFLAAHNFQQRWLHTHPALYPLVRLSRESPGDARFDRLARYIALLRQGGQWQNVPFFELRLFQKITLPLAPLVFVVLGALFGLEPLRSHRAVGVTLGTAVLFLYSVAIPLTTHVGSAGIVAPWLLATLPLALAMAAALLLLRLKARLEQQH